MIATAASPDLLAAIVAATRRIVDVRAAALPLAELERRAAGTAPRRHVFRRALERQDRLNVIAECKRRSPSRGVLKTEYDPALVAHGYDHAGAAAISVLTEPTFFDGSLDHLVAVRDATPLPLLRKDFIVDPYQIFEARVAGADAILLIVAAVAPSTLKHLHQVATEAGLDVLVEVHDVCEVPVALEAGATILGVNNRNLRTLAVDTEVSQRAVELIPDDTIAVAESGLKTGGDLRRLRCAGYDAFLIGERFMTTDNPGQALGDLLKGATG
ncbi:MAG: indole-3-glycerol phosphate synthase TrpC [Alphaproteobacteria bacterium]|nr:indole-3-glycerol phosphate synthase TrpC [Alphaproteobacteria bacterium]